MNIHDIIHVSADIQYGKPVFTGTRVPVVSLFLHLERGITIDEFLIDFPSVKKEQCYAAMELAGKMISSENFIHFYETAA